MDRTWNAIVRGIVCAGIILHCASALPAVEFAGGTGEPDDPYGIATAEQLIAIGSDSDLLDKHFILLNDIDLDPNLPGRKVFDRAVIAPDTDPAQSGFQGTAFTGVFDGNAHRLWRLTVLGTDYLGLFGRMGPTARVSRLGLEAVEVRGRHYVGGLAGWNEGCIVSSYSTGRGSGSIGVGGLVGGNSGSIITSYSNASLTGSSSVGGLIGSNSGNTTVSYSSGSTNGGGLVGTGRPVHVSACVWDTETSGVFRSVGGVGLTRDEMMDPYMLGLNGFADDPNWVLEAGRDYPRLAWEGTPGDTIPEPEIDWLDGQGTAEVPYSIDTADQLILLSKAAILWNRCFVLGADIDLDPALPGRMIFAQAVIPVFSGVFDGQGYTISNLTIMGNGYLGLFGYLGPAASVSNLGLEAVDVSRGPWVGGLVGYNDQGSIADCHSSGSVSGFDYVGGLVGHNERGSISRSHSTGLVSGYRNIGGLVGKNGRWWRSPGTVTQCYSSASVIGEDRYVGGLVGYDWGSIATSYSTGSVTGYGHVGGLVGAAMGNITASYSRGAVNGSTTIGGLVGYSNANITACYSTGMISGKSHIGGLVGQAYLGGGRERAGIVTGCFWDIQTSGQAASAHGTGKMTAEMQTAATFIDAGWDFESVWTICEGRDYPQLRWELGECEMGP